MGVKTNELPLDRIHSFLLETWHLSLDCSIPVCKVLPSVRASKAHKACVRCCLPGICWPNGERHARLCR
ncbi:Uncharacterized protein HZ326_16374 [Fusarium oxysporum f. sp. albedinis]|nr:Uncharacterized protein HZ326_16374 [Fusarium oxysporum f. sp. albedinis]